MNLRPLPRAALALAIAAALLGALVFLFVRTQSNGYKADVAALAALRDMKQQDASWDVDAQRLTAGVVGDRILPDRASRILRNHADIERLPQHSTLAAELPRLRDGIVRRQSAFAALQARHQASAAALHRAHDALAALVAEAAGARARTPRAAERLPELLARVEPLRAGLRFGDIESAEPMAVAIEPHLAVLAAAAVAMDPALGPAARDAEQAVRDYLAERRGEARAWREFTFLTVGGGIERTLRTLSGAMEAGLDERDRWRAYLVAYAAALLVGMGYLAWRVAAAQAALREANLLLEKRVAERTRELREAMRRLQDSEAQLVQSEKMSSLGRLVAGVAHEINTPLAYVKNAVAAVSERIPELAETLAQAERLLSLLRSETDARELQAAFDALEARLGQLAAHQVLPDLEELSRDGLHGIEQISDLVANLRSFSRLDRSRVASFDVNEGVRATLLIAQPALRDLTVEQRLGDIPPITCSPSQVNQVLLNLLTNAVQAMDKPEGRIVVATRREGPDAIAIEVADNGCGIAPEIVPRIFDPFFTTKEAGKGTGLGLSIAYKIVSQHGGRIEVASQPGAGSRFTVILPVAAPADAPAGAPAAELAA